MADDSAMESIVSCQKKGAWTISTLTDKWASDVVWLDDVFGRAESLFTKIDANDESQDSELEVLLPVKKTTKYEQLSLTL